MGNIGWHGVLIFSCMESKSAHIPPSWDYNPSAWSQRWPLIAVAFVGFQIAMYMGLYQLDIIKTVWDPFFEDGTRKVLNSSISKALPIPDAVLGAFGYILDVITGAIGGTMRWKTKPWIVILFGIAIGPLGMVSVLLIILQPLVVGAWCTLCIVTAVISIVMISPAMDELLASLQYLQRVKQQGHSTWKAFWGNSSIIQQVQ